MQLILCGFCGDHPCLCYKPLGLTRNELEELSALADATGLVGEALRQKWLERYIVGENDGKHAWTAIEPTKAKGHIPDIVPDDYPGESLDLYYAVFELYEKGVMELSGPPGNLCPTSKYLPTSRNRDRIKHLMMIYQIVPFSKRPKDSVPPVFFKKERRLQLSF